MWVFPQDGDGAEQCPGNPLLEERERAIDEFYEQVSQGHYDEDDLEDYLVSVLPQPRLPDPSVN